MKGLFFFGLLAWSALLQAVESGQAAPLTQAASLPRATYLEATGGLMLVILLIFGLGWLVKRLGMVPGSKGMVRILGGVSLGGRERALILEAEGRRILVGVAPGQVNFLMHLGESTAGPQPASGPDMDSDAKDFARDLTKALAAAKTRVEPSFDPKPEATGVKGH